MTHTPKTIKSMLMNYIIWNTRGANNAEFCRHCKSMISIHKSIMLVLLETKMVDHSSLTDEFGFQCHIKSSAIRASRGLVIMWTDDSLNITDISINNQVIHVSVKVSNPLLAGSLLPSMLAII